MVFMAFVIEVWCMKVVLPLEVVVVRKLLKRESIVLGFLSAVVVGDSRWISLRIVAGGFGVVLL